MRLPLYYFKYPSEHQFHEIDYDYLEISIGFQLDKDHQRLGSNKFVLKMPMTEGEEVYLKTVVPLSESPTEYFAKANGYDADFANQQLTYFGWSRNADRGFGGNFGYNRKECGGYTITTTPYQPTSYDVFLSDYPEHIRFAYPSVGMWNDTDAGQPPPSILRIDEPNLGYVYPDFNLGDTVILNDDVWNTNAGGDNPWRLRCLVGEKRLIANRETYWIEYKLCGYWNEQYLPKWKIDQYIEEYIDSH